jgi:large repetitive protein
MQRGLVEMSSVVRRSACKAACLLSLIAGVTVVPAFAQLPGVSLVPAITTLTGNGSGANAPASSPTLASSAGNQTVVAVVADTAGNVYFSDGNVNVVWKITRATGIMAHFAGTGANGSSGDGGPAVSAKFRGPQGLKFDSVGNLYIVDSGNSTVRRVDHVSGNITTVAGNPHMAGSTGDGGLATGPNARLYDPDYIAFDSANNLYIADNINNSIRRVDAATQIITTIAGNATTGSGQTGDGGLATNALLNHPNGLSFDQAGNLYIADQGNNAVRRIDAATLHITTVAGDPSSARASGSTGDGGPAAGSFLNAPQGVYVDTGGNLFIADAGNSVVREVTNDGNINTVAGVIGSAGFSGVGGAATTALLSRPADIAFDTAGNLFVADILDATVSDVNLSSTFPPTAVGSTSASQNLVLHVVGTRTITGITVPQSQGGSAEYAVGSISGAGCSIGSPIVDAGSGTDCELPATFHPAYPGLRGIPLVVATTISATPTIFHLGMTGYALGPQIAFTPALITTVAGNGTAGSTGNGGPATGAELHNPFAVAADYQGSLYISDANNNVVRRVDGSTHIITGFAGNGTAGFNGDSGLATTVELDVPGGLHLDSAGDLYLSDSQNRAVREVNAGTGDMSTVAGVPPNPGFSGDGGAATAARLVEPEDQALDSGGNLYIADALNNRIRRVDASSGIITTVAGNGTASYGGDLGPATAAELYGPLDLAVDAAGNLYIDDDVNNVIRKVTASTGIITTVAGVAGVPGVGSFGGDGGPATSAHLNDPEGIALDAAGNLYITDSGNNVVREVNGLTQIITTVSGDAIGNTAGYTGDLGPANAALVNYPMYPAFDNAGSLYFTDNGNNVIRKIAGVAPLSFGSITVSTSSTAQDVTITNNGTANLALTALTHPADYNLSGAGTTCTSSTVLAPAASCVLGIEFLPTVTGALNENLTITDNQGSQTIPLGGTGLPAATTTTVTLAPNPPVGGGNVTLIATIVPAPTGSPMGTVTFSNNGSAISGALAIDASGVATLTISNLPAATYSWTAAYTGNANHAASTSAAVVLTVASSVATGTTFAITPASSVNAGTAVTFTATVLSNSLPVYPGMVLFCNASAAHCDGSALLGSAPLDSSGVATFKFVPGFGTYSIKAVYPGVGTDSASASVSAAQTLTVNGIASYLSFSAIAATGVAGDYTLTGTVSAFGIAAPSGPVNFLNTTASTTIGSATLDPATLGSRFVQATGSPILLPSVQTAVAWEATGDFNGDGIPDLAAISSDYQSHAYVLLGIGDGTFHAPAAYAIGEYAAFVTVADVNNDGHPDIVVANAFSGNVGVLLGNANGTFGAQTTFPVGSKPIFVAAGDVNGDGILDLVVANNGDSTIGVLLGDGTGHFAAQVTYPVGGAPDGIAIGDFNGDGKPDLAVSNAYTYPSPLGSISLLMGAGNGTFAAATTLTVPAAVSPSAVLAVDLRGNGTLDLVFADNGLTIHPAAPAVYVMLGNNNGSFGALATYPTEDNAQSVTAGDINHDGILDLVVPDSAADGSGTSVSVLMGKGDGTFGAKTDYPVGGGGPYNAVLADFNGDGLLDISTANYSGLSVTALLQQQTEAATLHNASVGGTGPQLADASFAGDASHAGSVSATTSLTPLIATTNTLTSSAPAAIAGASVTFTATIVPVPTASPMGTVNFYSGGVLLGSGSVVVNSLGVATYTTTGLAAGAQAITAVFSGNASYSTSTSAAITETITAATATTSILTVAPNPVVAGQSATFTLTISPAPTGSPVGTVSFHNGGTLLGSGTVNGSGVATFSTTTLPLGTDLITAAYSGNAGFAGSTSTAISVQVNAANAAATTSILTVAPNPVVAGQSATFTLTISPAPTGSPLGTVSFHNGSTLLGTGAVNGSGVAIFSTTTLPVGTDSITAGYSGNAGFAGSTSTAISVQVNAANAAATVTAVASSNLAPTYGQSVTLTATVTPVPTAAPPGSIKFYAGTALLGAQAINAQGIATLSLSLPLGPNAITAVYSGSAGFAASTSSSLSVSARALSAITFSASPTTQLATMPVVFTAQVNSTTAGAQTGTVSFLNGSTVLATVTIVASQPAVYSETGLSSGLYSVTASYSGDGSFLPSASTGAPISITVSDLDLAIGGDKNKTVVPGGAVTYNFPLSPVLTPTFLYNVALTATGLPPGATYTFSPASIPAGSGTVPVAFTVQTAKTTAMLHRTAGSSRSPWFALAFGLLLPLAGAKRFRARLTTPTRMLLLLLYGGLSLGLVAGLGGCGSGGFLGTPAGQTSYTITINATSGTLVRTTAVQLNLE